ncbi:hypothetical protein DSO57_1011479 [Entomophthora muscae]|uniref:Uncharacterized protein n=1 Tax=Entomophthora muscae TaxID=34485 RepID=A0ACC2RXB4_9FUNG|nr:hypothetical protein DSO57_1011479 [Entomophthora muscae]
MPPPCGLVASPFSILTTISYNKQYLLIILSFFIGLLSSPTPSTELSLVQLQQDESFIDADLAQELGLSASENCLQIILGNSIKDTGYKCEQELPLVIGNNTYPSSLILLKGLPHPLILGDSWSDRHGLILNYQEQNITLGDKGTRNTVPFCTNPKNPPKGS